MEMTFAAGSEGESEFSRRSVETHPRLDLRFGSGTKGDATVEAIGGVLFDSGGLPAGGKRRPL